MKQGVSAMPHHYGSLVTLWAKQPRSPLWLYLVSMRHGQMEGFM